MMTRVADVPMPPGLRPCRLCAGLSSLGISNGLSRPEFPGWNAARQAASGVGGAQPGHFNGNTAYVGTRGGAAGATDDDDNSTDEEDVWGP